MEVISSSPFNGLRRTPLYELHTEHGGTKNPWLGQEIPSHYHSILDEHTAAIENLALFDLGFRGFVRLQGPGSATILDELCTLAASHMPIGAWWEAPMVYPDGTLVDLIRLGREDEQTWYIIFANPNYTKALTWVRERASGASCWIDDLSTQYSWIAISGARAGDYLACSSQKLEQLRKHQMSEALLGGVASIVWRGGHNFYEIACQPEMMAKVIRLWWVGEDRPQLSGWASYENWRLEKGVMRYGHELKDGVTPYELGLDKKVDLDRESFIGKGVLEQMKREPLRHLLVYFYIDTMRLPRIHSPIYSDQKRVGVVVSSGFGVEIKRPIASAWVATDEVDFDSLQVEVRRQRYDVKIKKPPL